MYGLSRYLEGFSAVRSNPNALVFAVIAGVPPDLVASGASIDDMLADERMTIELDGNTLRPACTREATLDGGVSDAGDAGAAGLSTAVPARRLLGLAKEFGERAVVTSICADAFTGPVEAIFRRISGVLACPDAPLL